PPSGLGLRATSRTNFLARPRRQRMRLARAFERVGMAEGPTCWYARARIPTSRSDCADLVENKPELVRQAIAETLRDPKARVAMLGIMRDTLDGRPGSERDSGPKVIVQFGLACPGTAVLTASTPTAQVSLPPADSGSDE